MSMTYQNTVTQPVWLNRMKDIDNQVELVELPLADASEDDDVSQDAEWCDVTIDSERRRVRFHDYHEIFAVPGLYEEIFYRTLRCCSPSRVIGLLEDVIRETESDMQELRVLDVGAGNGMVGDELDHRGVEKIVGIDIIEEAKEATQRDRPGVYSNYHVADLTNLHENVEVSLRKQKFNALTTVAALGFGDIPAAAFLKALDVTETPSWLAFNIKEDFLALREPTGFAKLIRDLTTAGVIRAEAYRRYRHRDSITGEPLYYVGMIARKLKEVPDALIKEYFAD